MSRIAVGVLIGCIALLGSVLGGVFWSVMVLVCIIIGHQELRTLMHNANARPSAIIVNYSIVLMVIATSLNYPSGLTAILHLAIIASFFTLVFRKPRARITDIGATLLSVFYMAYLPVHFILLRKLGNVPGMPLWEQPGLYYLISTLFVISFSDIGAYYVGRRFGKRLLYPEISPKKTREGAIGGLVTGIVTGVIVRSFFPVHVHIFHTVVLSSIIVVVGLMGDLTESFMKRDVGVKDSGVIFASHGGVLDRIDSYIFSGLVCYYYIYWFVMNQGLAQELRQWSTHLLDHLAF
jgi:phosphatidate cytidylyltransferase